MYCKLCNKHLYQSLSFTNLFKLHYHMHRECEQLRHNITDWITFPYEDLMVDYTYIFERGYEQSDVDYLFQEYYGDVMKLYIRSHKWSVLIDWDDLSDQSDINLILSLADGPILMTSMFYELELDTNE